MKVNLKKSMRVGRRFNESVVSLVLSVNSIVFCKYLRYLGLSFVTGLSLRCDFHKAKAKYFGALNSILGKLGKSPPKSLVLSLAASNCSPILSFGSEACNLTKSQVANLAFVENSIYM